MTPVLRQLRSAAVVLSLSLTVSACGDHTTQPLLATLGALTSGLASGSEEAPDLRAQLTPARVSALKRPLILVSIPDREAMATMSIFASTERINDWRSADNSSLVLEGGIIVGTRGLGADLFASDLGGLESAILSGSGQISKEQRFLDGENREDIKSYVCVVERAGIENIDLIARKVATVKVDETCRSAAGEQLQYVNSYWIGVEYKEILQSRQWINDRVGYVIIQHLQR